jgi:hypothetical protein
MVAAAFDQGLSFNHRGSILRLPIPQRVLGQRHMQTVFLLCLAIGGLVLVLQVALGMFGIDADTPELDVPDVDVPDADVGGSTPSMALELLSVRSVSAALAVFGAVGLWLDGFLIAPLAALLALGPAFAAAVLSAWLQRLMLRAESSGSLRLEGAVGALGTVYVPVPGANTGTGVVQFPLQGRIIELRARTADDAALPSGAKVLVISVDPDTETIEVVSTTSIEGLP